MTSAKCAGVPTLPGLKSSDWASVAVPAFDQNQLVRESQVETNVTMDYSSLLAACWDFYSHREFVAAKQPKHSNFVLDLKLSSQNTH